MTRKSTNAVYTVEHRSELIAMCKRIGVMATSRNTGVPNQTLHTWVKREKAGKLVVKSSTNLSPEQLEIRNLKAALAQAVMERDILKKVSLGTGCPVNILCRRRRTSRSSPREVRVC
jgi:transposase